MLEHPAPLLITIVCALIIYRSLTKLFAGSLDDE
jgi:hypothetical protein